MGWNSAKSFNQNKYNIHIAQTFTKVNKNTKNHDNRWTADICYQVHQFFKHLFIGVNHILITPCKKKKEKITSTILNEFR